MTATVTEPDVIAQRIAATIDPVFAIIDRWRDVVEEELATSAALGLPPTAAALEPVVDALVRRELESETNLVIGAGFVASPGFLADAPWHLSWWLSDQNTFRRGPSGGIRRLEAVMDPDAESFRDYTTLEWWRVPSRTDSRHLTGPYVDYLCTDDYTVTITTPVHLDGQMVGLVGTDLYVARLEQVMLPVIRESGRSCTLVNASARVVTSTDSRRPTGALLRLDGLTEALAPLRETAWTTDAARLPGGQTVVPCGDTSLALVVEG